MDRAFVSPHLRNKHKTLRTENMRAHHFLIFVRQHGRHGTNARNSATLENEITNFKYINSIESVSTQYRDYSLKHLGALSADVLIFMSADSNGRLCASDVATQVSSRGHSRAIRFEAGQMPLCLHCIDFL